MLSILRVLPSIAEEAGGVSEGVIQSSLKLIDCGLKVYIATLDDSLPESFPIGSIKAFSFGSGFFKYRYNYHLAQGLSKIINTYSIDLVVIEGLWQYHSYCARKERAKYGLPYLVFTHGMLDPWFKRAYPLKHLKKWVYWPWADYRVLRDASAVLFTTEQERLLARQSFWLYKANEVVVGYGTSSPPADAERQREAFLSRFPHLRGEPILLFLSVVSHHVDQQSSSLSRC